MRLSIKMIITLFTCCLANGLSAQTSDWVNKTRLLDSIYTSLYTAGSFNGTVLVAEKGKVMFDKSYGLANEQTHKGVNSQTMFDMASVSKQFTAMAIVLLKKRGKLKYDDLLSRYIPELSFYDSVTIRDLLNHTSGIPDYMSLFYEKWDKSKIATNDDLIREFATYKPALDFQPGQKWQYSNTGYALLASIIERVSTMPYGQFLKENIFIPVKMKNTMVHHSVYAPKKLNNYAVGYVTDSMMDKISPYSLGSLSDEYYLDGISGDGSVHSTAEDLLKWDRVLYSDKLINADDKKEIFTAAKLKDGKETSYGFGWRVYNNNEKYGKIVNHSGSWAGYITYIERHVDNDKTIIILQNYSTPVSKVGLADVRKVLYNQQLDIKPKLAIELTSADLDKYIGIYSCNERPVKMRVFKKGNRLIGIGSGPGQRAFPLDAFPDNTFKCESIGLEIIFNPDDNSMKTTQGKSLLTYKMEK
ncbi:MAG: serine hydrolase domain-containing protein [Chitinophagaceae bacterium]